MKDSEMLNLILDKVVSLDEKVTDLKSEIITNFESEIKKTISYFESEIKKIIGYLDSEIKRISYLDSEIKRISYLESEMKKANGRLDKIDNEIDKLNSRVSSLKIGQIDIRKEIKEVNIKVSDTDQLALDAWGMSTENRKWLETVS